MFLAGKRNPLMLHLLVTEADGVYISARPLFVSTWSDWDLRAFADASLHDVERCVEFIREFDPLSIYPPGGLQFSTLWSRGVELDMKEWSITFKDYPIPYLLTKNVHFFGSLVGAEEFEERGRSIRECQIPLPKPWESLTVERNMAPLKFYYDMQCESSDFSATYGPCWEPCLSMISLMWNNINAPSRDPSIPLPFWDKLRFLLHGRFSWLSSKVVTTMLASPDPYNTTETVEICWDEFGLDWGLGEVRICSALRVFMRTASRYDDSRILFLPDLRLRIILDWICSGDPHDHHAVTICAPHRLPHYSMDHDSYRAFRSSSLDLSLSFDVAAGAGNGETGDRLPHVLLYANTFRCIEFLLVHVYSNGHVPSADGISSDEETFLLGLNRVSYVRENNRGNESAQHRLTVHDLKASWTAQNRDSCITIADGVHRAHMLRRILSNDALKILKLHMEEEGHVSVSTDTAAVGNSSPKNDSSHRRGFSMSDQNQSLLNQLIGEASQPLILYVCVAVDLLNSQVVLKGCERAGFVLLTAARASVTQKVHRCVWRNGQLLGKKSWSSVISGMQYFAPVSIPIGRNFESSFRWLSREVIEEKTPSGAIGDPYLHPYIGAGEAVGGVVDVEESTDKIQLQRIVSRCSCEIYFCYFSEELKTDTLEESGVPKVEQETAIGGEETGVDCFTLKHNMLEAVSNSDQYEMMVDIVNNLVLFVHPKKKELAERRRKLQFACKMADMNEMREKIVEQQSDLRDIVSVVRSLERQLFYLDTQSDGNIDEQKRREIVEEMEENKTKQLEVSEKLAIYISCYKQRQVEAARATVCSKLEEEDILAAVARRFEVCFEDCIWKLTECDGQIAIAQIQIRNFLLVYVNILSMRFQIGTIRVTNLLPDTIYRDTLHRDERVQSRQPSIRLMVRDMAPVGGICVKELFEVNIAPMVAQLTYRFFEKIMLFFFPGRNIHKEDNLDSVEEGTPKFSLTRRIAGTLSMRSNKPVQVERKSSNNNSKHVSGKQTTYVELTDFDKMRERADNNNFFLYIKIPEVPFVVSYKGSKDKNIEDVDRFSFLFPLCEFHERNWTWLDVALAVKQRCKRVLLQQVEFMRQKLLRNRLTGGPETVEGISEEDKKRIALGREINMLNDLAPELSRRKRAAWEAFKAIKDVVKRTKNTRLRAHLFDSTVLCALTYASETWSLRKQDEKSLSIIERVVEMTMQEESRSTQVRDEIRNTDLRQRSKIKDTVLYAKQSKIRWAGHVMRINGNR
ncbi:unnamed protein product [Angiostrongylus costaricensis]|uniref:Fmp27_GFWDK domain-containing protein n=1 Tax=Angiostrongylus costaricensis TaxID=334426 RepID=A0A158PD01_ANGCS|nr:unnamed protein product [Angiostrongylus costaricensis]